MNQELHEKLQDLIGKVVLYNETRYFILGYKHVRGFYVMTTDSAAMSLSEEKALSFVHFAEVIVETDYDDNVLKRKTEEKKRVKKTGMTKRTKQNLAEFMKVREGEDIEQWYKRTSYRRLKMAEQEENSKIVQRKQEKIRKKDIRRYVKFKKENIIILKDERQEDFMYLHGLMRNWASLKFGISRDDLEVFLYFYKLNRPFSKAEFEVVTKAIKGNRFFKLSIFLKKNYIVNLYETYSVRGSGSRKALVKDSYKLSNQINYRMIMFYKKYLELPKGAEVEGKSQDFIEALRIKELIDEINDFYDGTGTKSVLIKIDE